MQVLKRRGSSPSVLHGAVLVAHGPLGMSFEGVGPVEIGAHARDDAHATLLCGGDAFAEEVAVVKEFSVAMEFHLRGIEGEDAGDADEDDVGAGGVPVVGPLLDVHDGRIVLGHVALADAADFLLPGESGGIFWGEAGRQGNKGWRVFGCRCGLYSGEREGRIERGGEEARLRRS